MSYIRVVSFVFGLLSALQTSATAPKFSSRNSAVPSSSSANSTAEPPALRILAGGYAPETAVLEFDPFAEPNTLKVVSTSDGGSNEFKGWIGRHPVNPNLLVSCNDDAVANVSGIMQSFALDPATGAISLIDTVDTGGFQTPNGISAAYCQFFPDGNVAGVANYYGQTVSTFLFDSTTGKFGEQINNGSILSFPGYQTQPGQVPSRQESSHPHQLVFHPWLDVLYIPDLGEDLLRVYTFTDNGTVSNLTQYHQATGSGPRHAAIAPSGQYLYLLHELALTIRSYKINTEDGTLTQIQDDMNIFPPNATLSPNISAAEVHISNDGRFLYASNRNLTDPTLIQPNDPSDTIAVWSIDPSSGTLKSIQNAMFPGARQIRGMELSRAGDTASAGGQDFVVAGSLLTNTTAVFKRDKKSGKLSFAAIVEHPDLSAATYIWV